MNTWPENPYIGPSSFRREEASKFFGRENEARDLLSLVISEQLVLFYAQSGAGKSSLINTCLIPGLEEKRFEVLPVGRVSGAFMDSGNVDNIYVFNLLLSLDQSKRDPRRFTHIKLTAFLNNLTNDGHQFYYADRTNEPMPGIGSSTPVEILPRALIIDQFEEIISTSPEAWQKREDFFRQLAGAMKADPYLWVVLVMREDFIAALDPYAHVLPNGLRARYYMQMLGREAALKAIKGPVQELRPFTEGVAEKLVEDLCSINLQKPDGTLAKQPGQYVEPVQLQVVCYSLWKNLSPIGRQITEKDLQEVGDVDQSLADYYASSVINTVTQINVSEREIRAWFEYRLITKEGFRGQVLRGTKSSNGLNNPAIRLLEDTHIIRSEKRAGATWIELAHDRLIDPVRKNNALWFENNLSILQRQAVLWHQQGRPDGLLLRGEALLKAEREARETNLSLEEQAFLDACQKARQQDVRNQRRNRWITFLAIGASVATIVAGFFWYQSNRQARLASAGQYAAFAQAKSQNQLDLSLLLSREAYRLDDNYHTRGTLLDMAGSSPHLRQYLFGHGDSVGSVAFGPDGNTLASGSWDNTIILWELRNPAAPSKLATLQGHTGSVNSIAFSPNGKILASASEDDTVIFWDLATFRVIGKPLKGHSDNVYSVAFSPDGKMLASGSWDDSIILWDVATHQPIGKPLIGHNGDVYSVAFSSDGILASGSLDTTIILWDLVTHQPIGEPLEANNDYVESVTFSPNGTILASAGFDGAITLWDVPTHQQIVQLKGHSNWVSSVAFSPDGKTLISGSADGTIILWSVAQRQPLEKPLTGHSGTVLSVAFSPDGKTLASAGLEKAVILWNASARQPISRLLTTGKVKINSVAISPNGKMLASGSDDFNFTLWEQISTLQPISSPHQDHHQYVEAVAFSPDGKLLASGGYGTGIIAWDLDKGQSMSPPLLVGDKDFRFDFVFSLAFSPNGKILASGNWEDSIVLWDVARSKRIGELKGHQPSADGEWLAITSLAFSPDGKLLASGSEDKTIILWDVITSQPVARLTGHTGSVYSVAFSLDGRTLASASFDRTIILWDLTTRKQISQLKGHISSVQRVAFSRDGKTLASGSADKTIILWDLESRQPIGHPLIGHTGPVYSLVFHPDGKTLISASKEIIVWDLDPRSWVEKSCQRAGRNFTRAEWTYYFPHEGYRATCPQWSLEQETTPNSTP